MMRKEKKKEFMQELGQHKLVQPKPMKRFKLPSFFFPFLLEDDLGVCVKGLSLKVDGLVDWWRWIDGTDGMF